MANVAAKWSGAWPCLCLGEWTLIVDGKDVSHLIPEDLRGDEMGTYGTYRCWHFVDWIEEWDEYTDGLMFPQWYEKNKYWLDNISTDRDVCEEIYEAISIEDFRHGSCGGCI